MILIVDNMVSRKIKAFLVGICCLDVVSCPALPHVKMLPYNLTRQTSFLLPVLLFVAVNIRLCKLMESEKVGKTVVPIFRPDICHFFSTNVLLGTIFPHMKVRKLWQNFATKQRELDPVGSTVRYEMMN